MRFVSLSVASILVSTLAACGGGGGDPTEDESTQPLTAEPNGSRSDEEMRPRIVNPVGIKVLPHPEQTNPGPIVVIRPGQGGAAGAGGSGAAGASGAAGDDGGTAGSSGVSGGNSGTAGAGGAAGTTGTAGAGGSAGGAAGTTGTAGAGGSTGGAGGTTGTGGSAAGTGGTTGTAGSAGATGTAGAGASTGGAAGTTGTAGAAGTSGGSAGAAGTAGSGGAASPTCKLPAGMPARGMWIWGGSVAESATESDALFDFANAHAVTTLYIESQGLISKPATLKSFIAAAAERCIQVELLYGYSQWALPSGHATVVDLVKKSVDFAEGITSGPLPVGVQLDVEPYLLDPWDADLNTTANQYLDMLQKTAAEVKGSPLSLTAAIPFWFDGKQVTRNGQTRPLSEWVLDIVDRVAIVDYRDTASAAISNAADEVAYAAKVGKGVVIGLETLCIEPETITFCEEGKGALHATLSALHAEFGSSPAYDGLAVHDYKAYKALKP